MKPLGQTQEQEEGSGAWPFQALHIPPILQEAEGIGQPQKRKAIFLDRDGVINPDMGNHPCAEHFRLFPGVPGAIARLRDARWLCVVVTNQPMIAKGFVTFEEVEATHVRMCALLREEGAQVDAVYFCPHHPEKGFPGERPALKVECDCRKPRPGLLLRAAKEWGIELEASWMIGDHPRDVVAGCAAGCRTIHLADRAVDPGKWQQWGVTADFICDSLEVAVDFILGERIYAENEEELVSKKETRGVFPFFQDLSREA